MKTVHEVSKISGISIRALHHYDAIGLLKPTALSASGYRLYDDNALLRLQAILMFRELGFGLSDIAKILSSEKFDLKSALAEHVQMLKMQRDHIDGLIFQAEKMMKGENVDFKAFDKSEMDKYAEEVKAKWGNTGAYRESQEKAKNKTGAEKNAIAEGLMAKFAAFGAIKDLPADSKEANSLVHELASYITENYYNCTNEILAGLGEMYTQDDRFRESIDNVGGVGTAAFVGEAIKAYVRAK